MSRLQIIFPILAVAIMLSLFGCGETFSGTTTGIVVTKWGPNGTGDGEFEGGPNNVAAASGGSIYVADSDNDRIQKSSPGP